MKKALAGPRKPARKEKAKRRAMIAAARRRMRRIPAFGLRLSRRLDRRADRLIAGFEPLVLRLRQRGGRAWRGGTAGLLRLLRPLGARLGRLARWVGRRSRPFGAFAFRLLGFAERRVRAALAAAARAATRASRVLTPERAICGVILAAAACLAVSQFVHYRGVEVGRPGYAGLPEVARAPAVDRQTPIDAHSFALLAVALLAGAAALLAARRRRARLGRAIFLLGLLSAAVVLLVDRPAGLDVGEQVAFFSGAEAVLEEGFYAQLASAAGLMLGGALLVVAPKAAARYHARPCRTRTNLYARAASALRRRRRRRASSRPRGARRPSRRRSGAASAPASPR
jgi:hypothetical protein